MNGKRLLGGLFTLLLIGYGVTRGWTDQTLVTYHNEFVHKVYGSVTDGWNEYVNAVQADGVTAQMMVERLESQLLPVLEAAAKDVQSTTPPDFAAEYHGQLATSLMKANTEAKKLRSAFDTGDSAGIDAALGSMNAVFQNFNENLKAFQKKLEDERDFDFDK